MHLIFHFKKHIFIPLYAIFYILGSMKRKTWSLFQSIHGLEGIMGDGKREHWHFRNQWTKMEWNGWIWFRWPLYLLKWERSLRRNGVALIVKKKKKKKSLKCSIWVQSPKWQNDLSSFSGQTIQYHSNPNLCPNH